MRDEHIISIIESTPFFSLSESDAAKVRAHATLCPECRRALEAAQISALLLREHAGAPFEPSPFFQTRVLAALRERQATVEISVLQRLWRATGALVSSMAVIVVALVILTFFAPGSRPTTGPQETTPSLTSYSAEEVILDQDGVSEDRMSYGQVLATLYGPDDER